jgi:glycosyltransferase domain-containing protein
MQDFTLVIPTYNRPKPLEALLAYLRAKKQRCRILILDSSLPPQRAANRNVIALTDLKIQYSEFPSEMHPFDKFREGVHQVSTEFCALCADDDLVVLDGIERCLDTLRRNPQASVAQGYSFSFQCQPNGDMDIGSILYFTSTVDDATPLARLATLFGRYQAATYGNYRTPVLQRILTTIRPMTSILGRELLGSALAAIDGQMIRVPCFSHGRSMDASESYQHWHPLEWFAKDPQGLFSEYRRYRELMEQAVLERPDNNLDAAAVRRILDLINLRYMIKHAPDGALAFMTQQKLFGAAFEEYWPRQEIHQPLYEAACIGTAAPVATEATSFRRSRFGKARAYHLHPNFSAPLGVEAPAPDAVKDLLLGLDDYRFLPPAVVPVRMQLPARTRLPLRRSISVSVLLCNYNHARYLPDSLSAICTQTRLPEELVVLDDGSTDDSLQIIRDFGRRYPFIRILRNETNRGLLYSINRALNAARCDFIVWAASDDRLMPNFIERNAQCLRQHPSAGLSISRLAVFKDGSDDITTFTEKNHGVAFDFGTAPHFLSPQMLRERLQRSHLWISANTVMASRTALLQAGGFDQELRWHADYFGFLAVALRHGLCCIPETLAAMRQRDETYSSTGMANRREQLITLGRLADKLTSKGCRDIGVAVLRCPALLSPFGGRMLGALLRKPRRWPFAVTFGLWWANHKWGGRGGVVALVGHRSTRMALQAVLLTLEGAGRFVRWAKHR